MRVPPSSTSVQPGLSTRLLACMRPLSHAMSDGYEADLEAPSEATPGVASSMKSLRNMRRWVSLPPCRVTISAEEKEPLGTLPLTTWYWHTSAVSTPPAASKSSTTRSVGTNTVMSGWLRSTPLEAHAAANFLYASWPLMSDSSFRALLILLDNFDDFDSKKKK